MMTRRPRARIARTVLFGLFAAVFVAVGLPRLHVGTGVDSFLPAHDPSVRALNDLASDFGGDPVVVLLETKKSDVLLGQDQLPKLLRLEGALAALPDVAVVYGPATTLNQTVIRVQDLLAELSGERDALRESGRTADLKNFEKRYGELLVSALPGGLPTLRNAQFVKSVIYRDQGSVAAKWSQFVPNHQAVAIYVRPRQGLDQDAASRLSAAVRRTVAAAGLGADEVTVTGAPVVTADLAAEARSELPVLGGAAFATVALALFAVRWERTRRRLLPLIPMAAGTLMTLAWFGWRGSAVSLGAVAFLPVILGVGSYYPVYLAQSGHRRRVLTVAAAAAAAFGSLMLSPLPFVRDLGEAIALGIGFVVLASLALGVSATAAESKAMELQANEEPNLAVRPGRMATVVAMAVVACIGWAVLPHVSVNTDPQKLVNGLEGFSEAQHAEGVIGSSGEVDVVLNGPDVLSPAALAWMRQAQDAIVTKYGDKVRPIVSPTNLLDFLGTHPTPEEVSAALRLVPDYLTGATLTADRKRAVLSLGGTWSELDEQRGIIKGIQSSLASPPVGYQASVTGLPVAASRGYELVSASRYPANLWGILAATAVLAIGLRRRKDALLGFAAASIATGLAIFTAWLGGVALSPLTLALGPLTAAAGCEFATLLAAARRDRDDALRRSVYLAAGLSAAGYGVLAFSGLVVVRDFGLALVVSLGFALLSALAVTRLVPQRSLALTQVADSPNPRLLETVGV
jgi:predicted RND superfamily exporter protein